MSSEGKRLLGFAKRNKFAWIQGAEAWVPLTPGCLHNLGLDWLSYVFLMHDARNGLVLLNVETGHFLCVIEDLNKIRVLIIFISLLCHLLSSLVHLKTLLPHQYRWLLNLQLLHILSAVVHLVCVWAAEGLVVKALEAHVRFLFSTWKLAFFTWLFAVWLLLHICNLFVFKVYLITTKVKSCS